MIDVFCNKVVDFSLVQVSISHMYITLVGRNTIFLFQSNEVGGSYHMEKEGLNRVLDFLQKQQGAHVEVLVTDRHRQINKWLREEHKEITHYYDVWHVAKGMFIYNHM